MLIAVEVCVIDIGVLVSVIGIVDDVLLWLAAWVALVELLAPQPAAASATPASGAIR
jgi:hypothetical protein